jgi:hypothetical protein
MCIHLRDERNAMELNYSKLYYFVRTDIVVIDYNSEMADMSNPRGEIHGDADYIIAETPTGRRFAHQTTALTYPNGTTKSDVTCARLEELAHHLNTTKPVLNMDHWAEIDPCYGSEAYIAQDTEAKNRYREIREAVAAGEMGEGEAFNLMLHEVAPL